MKPVLLGLFSLLTLASLLRSEEEVIWKRGFKDGPAEAVGYRGIETVKAIEKGGEHFLRITLPGKQTLEGVRIPMGPVEGNRLMIVTAKVRGSGIVGPMVQAANGWTRLPQVTLSEKWQEVRIPRTLKAGTNQPVVYFVSLPLDAIQPGAIFEIADLRATLAPPLALADQEVRPKSFKPEDYAPGVPLVQEEDWRVFGSLRGGFVSEEIPFPQTRRPVMVYLRYRPASVKDRILIRTLRGGCKQGLREVAPASGGWQWLAFPNLSAEEAGEAITIDVRPDKAAGKPAGLGALVLATAPALGEDALDSLP